MVLYLRASLIKIFALISANYFIKVVTFTTDSTLSGLKKVRERLYIIMALHMKVAGWLIASTIKAKWLIQQLATFITESILMVKEMAKAKCIFKSHKSYTMASGQMIVDKGKEL